MYSRKYLNQNRARNLQVLKLNTRLETCLANPLDEEVEFKLNFVEKLALAKNIDFIFRLFWCYLHESQSPIDAILKRTTALVQQPDVPVLEIVRQGKKGQLMHFKRNNHITKSFPIL